MAVVNTYKLTEKELAAYNEKKATKIKHLGSCSSPRMTTCPCMDSTCPLHGRCCDCIRNHILKRESQVRRGQVDRSWFPSCIRMAQDCDFEWNKKDADSIGLDYK